MKLGLENKQERWKAIVLGVLGVVVLYTVYTNLISDGTNSPSPASKATPSQAPDSPPATSLTGNNSPGLPQRRGIGGRGNEFRPKVPGSRAEDRVDPAKVDPTIKLDLLARVQNVALDGGSRNIFQFGAAAPPAPIGPIPKVPIIPLTGVPVNSPPVPTGPAQPPPAPQIPFKYYGYSSVKGEPRKRAFFLDGEDIIVAWEGDMIKNRYKVIRIGLTSVDMEDTQFKSRQSLPLAEDIAG